jgi:hypothetical protein
MKCNAILETSIAVAAEGDMSKWHGATLLNGGYISLSYNEHYRKKPKSIISLKCVNIPAFIDL